VVLVGLTKEEVSRRAIQFFGDMGYNMISRTEESIVFEDGRDISMVTLILGTIFLLFPAILYYLLANKHMVNVTIREVSGGVNVECSTNTTGALSDGQDFLTSLSAPHLV